MKDGKKVHPSEEADQSFLEVEPVTGRTLKGQNVVGIYAMTRPGPMLTPDMKPGVLPYFASYTKTEATTEQIDMIGKPLNLIGTTITFVRAFCGPVEWCFA